MSDQPAPFSLKFDLASLGEAEKTLTVSPFEKERAAIASWAGIEALDAFSARLTLKRAGDNTYDLLGSFTADVTQSCVITLDPVHAHLEGTLARHYRVLPPRARRHAESEDMTPGDEEEETLESSVVDVAQPVLEDFVLAIDPYPRAPDAAFEPPSDPDKPANPFAVLGKLKTKG